MTVMKSGMSDLAQAFSDFGWCVPNPQVRESLEKQLQRELTPAHPLAGRSMTVLVRALGTDDAAFLTDDGVVALVHLTYNPPDPDGCWPFATMFPDVSALLQHLAQADEG